MRIHPRLLTYYHHAQCSKEESCCGNGCRTGICDNFMSCGIVDMCDAPCKHCLAWTGYGGDGTIETLISRCTGTKPVNSCRCIEPVLAKGRLPLMKETALSHAGFRFTSLTTGARLTVGPFRSRELAEEAMAQMSGGRKKIGFFRKFHLTPSWNGTPEAEHFEECSQADLS